MSPYPPRFAEGPSSILIAEAVTTLPPRRSAGLAFGSVQSASANITAGKSSTKASADGYNMTGIKRQGLTKAQKREILDRKRASALE